MMVEEMVEVMGGLESRLFGEFVKSFTAGRPYIYTSVYHTYLYSYIYIELYI
jgi:hypothetical protein